MPATRPLGPGITAASLGRVALAALFPLVVFFGLTIHTVNVPMYDEWIWSPLVVKAFAGTLGIADLWAQQGSHRSLVPTALALGLARIDGWDTRVETVCSLALAVATQAMLGWFFARRCGARASGVFLLVSAVLFSLAQSENWVWGFQLSWFLVDACVVAVVVLLDRDLHAAPGLRLALAIVAAFFASYSLIFGCAAWIAGGVAVRDRRAAVIWWSSAAVCGALFLAGYHLPAGEHGWLSPSTIVDGPQFFLAYLGSPLGCFGGRWLCESLGAAVLVACCSLLARARRDSSPWIGLFSLAAVAAALDTLGRAANGVDAATAFRYTTPASFAWIALIGLAAESDLSRRVLLAGRAALVALVVVAEFAGYVYGYVLIGMQRTAVVAVRNIAHADDDELSEYANDPVALRRDVAELRAGAIGPFSGGVRSVHRNARLDGVDRSRRIASDETKR